MLNHSLFNPASPQGLNISDLFNATVIIALAVLALVLGVLFYSIVRFRAKPNGREPSQTHGNRRLEIAWTVATAVVLLIMFGITVPIMNRTQPPSANPAFDDIVVVAHQWWWEIRYPHSGVVTANEIHLPVGKRMQVALQSGDVVHAFWIPQLNGKFDHAPGQTNHIWLEADRPGIYSGACSEYCGGPHAWMLLRAIAQTPAQFAAWERQQARPSPAANPGPAAKSTPGSNAQLAAQGAMMFGQLACVGCHAIAGTPYQVMVGPSLSHVGSRQTLAAGVLTNTPENMARWISNPQAIKPGNHMPSLQLAPDQVRAVTAYLESLK
jgi:cytochrome c oxidase subunit 2